VFVIPSASSLWSSCAFIGIWNPNLEKKIQNIFSESIFPESTFLLLKWPFRRVHFFFRISFLVMHTKSIMKLCFRKTPINVITDLLFRNYTLPWRNKNSIKHLPSPHTFRKQISSTSTKSFKWNHTI